MPLESIGTRPSYCTARVLLLHLQRFCGVVAGPRIGLRGYACSPRKPSAKPSARPKCCRRPWTVPACRAKSLVGDPTILRDRLGRSTSSPSRHASCQVTTPSTAISPPQPVWGRMTVMLLTLACFRAPAAVFSLRDTGGRSVPGPDDRLWELLARRLSHQGSQSKGMAGTWKNSRGAHAVFVYQARLEFRKTMPTWGDVSYCQSLW